MRYYQVLLGRLVASVTSIAAIIGFSSQALAQSNNLTIKASDSKTFSDFTKQAESSANQHITQIFANQPNTAAVSVMVLGDRNGSISPLLSINISRNDWRIEPSIKRWAKYYTTSDVLLGYVVRPRPVAAAVPTPKPVAKPDPTKPNSSSTPQTTTATSSAPVPANGSNPIPPAPTNSPTTK